MKTLTLPAGTQYVRFDELAHLIAYAMHPLKDDDSPGDGLNYGNALVSLEAELQQAFESGALPVKDPLTHGPNVGHCRLEDTLVRVADLQVYLGDRLLVESDSTPSGDASQSTVAPELKQAAQENRILELIVDAGHDALKMPKSEPGKKRIKSTIKVLALKERALFTSNSFDKAWQRLRGDKRLAGD